MTLSFNILTARVHIGNPKRRMFENYQTASGAMLRSADAHTIEHTLQGGTYDRNWRNWHPAVGWA